MRISIEGNIGSGKSTCMQHLAEVATVPLFPEPVEDWGELLRLFYASPSEWGFAFNLKVLLGFCEPGRLPQCVVERSPLASRHVFGQVMYNRGMLSQQEWDLFKEYHAVVGWEPDVIFFIDTPAEVCMQRVAARRRPGEEAVDEEYLRQLEFQYHNMLDYCKVPVVRFDGTLPMAELHAAVAAAVAQHMQG
jgi:thymidine kinase